MDNRNSDTTPPVETQMHYETTPEKPRRRRSRPLLLVLLVIIVALLAGAAGIFGYKNIFEKSSSTSKNVTSSVSGKKVTSASAGVLVAGVSEKLKGTPLDTHYDMANNLTTTPSGNFGLDSAPLAQPTNGAYFTAPASFSKQTVASNTDLAVTNVYTADTYLLSQGMTADSVNVNGQDGNENAHFHNGTTICTVSQTTYALKEGSGQVTVNCADLSQYDATAKSLQPVYEAYTTAKPDQKSASLYFYGHITDSQTTGYKTADVNTGDYFAPFGGSAALLYMTPDNQWHYFINTQNTLLCSQFNSKQLKDAYAGTKCMDDKTSQMSTVKAE